MKILLIGLLLVCTISAQGFRVGQKIFKYQLEAFEFYTEQTQQFIDESIYLIENDDALLDKYENYLLSLQSLWDDLSLFQKALAKVCDPNGVTVTHFDLLMSNIQTLDIWEEEIIRKYNKLSSPDEGYSAMGIISSTLIAGGLYLSRDWAMQPERNYSMLGGLAMIPITDKLNVNIGHWQGITVGLDYRILRSYPNAGAVIPVDVQLNAQITFNRFSVRKLTFGPTVQLRFWKGLYIYSGLLAQVYVNRLEEPGAPAEFYQLGIPVVGIKFNPFYK